MKKFEEKNKNNSKNNRFNKFLRLFFVIFSTFLIFFVIFIILKKTNLWEKINSIEKVKALVEKGGVLSFLLFMFLQLLQTTVLQLPAFIVTVAGSLVFGAWPAFGLSFVSVMIGSIIMFLLGRKLGRKFLNFLIGKQDSEKWIERLDHGKYLYFLMMLFPLFPDDILCVVAGVTNMSFRFFFWTNVIARSIGIFCTVFLGSGKVIPFYGWGIPVWIAIGTLVAVLFYLSVRFQDKIDEVMKQFSRKKNN